MDSIHALFDSQFIYALGWTIVHSFWQSLLVFVLLSISLLMNQRSRPEVRYWLSMIALVCCLVISVKTFIYCYQDVALASRFFTQVQSSLDSAINQHWVATFKTINPWLDTIVLAWCIGFVFQGMRFAFDIATTQKLKYHSTTDLPQYWNSLFIDLAKKLGVTTRVTFLQSTKITIPCVIGHFKPVILLPLGILSQLPQSQIEAIMLHELAHIKRHDYMINILQSLVKVLFFFNPFVLNISKNIDIERENICDDLAVKVCGDPLVFANSLSQFADVTSVSQSAIAATKDQFLLLARVKRLFSTQAKLATSAERLIAVFCVTLLGLTLNVNAKSQPAPVAAQPSTQPSTQLALAPPQNEQPALPQVNAVTPEPEVKTLPLASAHQTASLLPESSLTAIPTETIEQKSKVSVPQIISTPQRAVLRPQAKKPAATSAARDYLESEVKAQIKALKNSPLKTKGRVFAQTPKFDVFSLESAVSLENIEQLIFAPISTSETQLTSQIENGKRISNQYFLELKNKPAHGVILNSSTQSTHSLPLTKRNVLLGSSLIAQVRIKDVKMLTTDAKNYDNKELTSKHSDDPSQFIWDVTLEVLLVEANSYEYSGYAIKQIRLDSSELTANELNKPRHSGSRAQSEPEADLIKNAWDILIAKVQSDVFHVASAIKNQELELTSAAKPENLLIKTQPINKQLASQYYRVKNSELEEFIISSTDSLDAFTQTTYLPLTTNQVQLNSKQDGWNHLIKLALYHLSNQPTQSYIFATNHLALADSSTATDDQNLVIQIDVKQMELYSRSAIRNYRTDYEINRGSNYNRGATATETGLSPSKDDVGGASPRKVISLKPSAFDSKLYLRGQFEITLIDPQTHKILGHAISNAAVNPKHSAFKTLAQQIKAQNLQITEEEMLVIALFGDVKNQLHKELRRVQQGDVSVDPIQLTAERKQDLTDAPLRNQHKGADITVAHLAY